MEKYNAFSVADFLDDAGFIAYIKYDRDWDEWRRWLGTDPSSVPAFEEASVCLRTILSAERILPSADAAGTTLGRIRSEIDELQRKRATVVRIRRYLTAAACLLIVAGAGWFYYNDKVTITTDFAQQRTVVLPDNSTITLNAHSSVSWFRAWRIRHQREVWLTGEALFKVRHLNTDSVHVAPEERFTAHAGDVVVQVLGTTFNIRQRRSAVEVSLIDGRISVSRAGQRPAEAPLILKAGETVRYTGDSAAKVDRIVSMSSQPQAWVDHSIQAHGMTVQDIIDHYEDTYGNRIILGDPSMAARKIDGTLSLNTGEGVLYMLANILNANIHREGRVIYLRPK